MAFATQIKTLAAHLGAAVYPPRCPACEEALPLQPMMGLCEGCLLVLAENDSPPPQFKWLDDFHSPYLYGGPLANLIQSAKFSGHYGHGKAMAALLAGSEIPEELLYQDAQVCPIPIARMRLMRRGYNQSRLLAKAIANNRGGEFCPVLRRVGLKKPQSKLGRDKRSTNVIGVFRSRKRTLDGRFLLVDDVCTTGSTLDAAAKVLKDSGASFVAALTLARSADTDVG